MRRAIMFFTFIFAILFSLVGDSQNSAPPQNSSLHLSDPFSNGWMLVDTDGDGIVDAIVGNIVVPDISSAAENSAAANFAARLAYGSTGLNLPLVVTVSQAKQNVPSIRILNGSVNPAALFLMEQLQKNEGCIIADADSIAVMSPDAVGLAAAADAFSSRAPYQWKVPGEKLSAIEDAVNTVGKGSGARLIGLVYSRGEQGIHRAVVSANFTITASDLATVFNGNHLGAVHELFVVNGTDRVSAANPKPLPTAPANAIAAGAETNSAGAAETIPAGAANVDAGSGAAGSGAGGAGGGAGAAPPATKLDLATLYTSRGLFTGNARMPIPSASDAHLYIPSGAEGIAMANFAARMGMETTGLTLPIASPAADVTPRQVRRRQKRNCARTILLQRKRKPRWLQAKAKCARWMKHSAGAARFWCAEMKRVQRLHWNCSRSDFRICGKRESKTFLSKKFVMTCTDCFRCGRARGKPPRRSTIWISGWMK
jgi:hypothetical protein